VDRASSFCSDRWLPSPPVSALVARRSPALGWEVSADGEAAVVAAGAEVEALLAACDAAMADVDAAWSSGGQSRRRPNGQLPSLVSPLEHVGCAWRALDVVGGAQTRIALFLTVNTSSVPP